MNYDKLSKVSPAVDGLTAANADKPREISVDREVLRQINFLEVSELVVDMFGYCVGDTVLIVSGEEYVTRVIKSIQLTGRPGEVQLTLAV